MIESYKIIAIEIIQKGQEIQFRILTYKILFKMDKILKFNFHLP